MDPVRDYPELPAEGSVGNDKVGSRQLPPWRFTFDHLICPIGAVHRKPYSPKAALLSGKTTLGGS
jgi:hypothetical protein